MSANVAECKAMAAATDDQFEDALKAARADGDLSRENVVRKLGTDRTVTGLDGKSYSRPAEPRTQNRPALPPQFVRLAADFDRLIRRLEKLRADDRYRANKVSIADRCVPEFRRTIEVLTDLMDDLAEDDYEAETAS